MNHIAHTLSRRKVGIAAACVALVLACVSAVGCGASTQTNISGVPSDHYVNGQVGGTIDFNHTRCITCHSSVAEDFAVSGSDLMKSHIEAYADYQAGNASDNARAIIDKHPDEMAAFFSKDSNGSNCSTCHSTSLDESGLVVIGDINTIDYCETCHDYDQAIATTSKWGGAEKVNPHDSHLGEFDCSSCHRIHAESDEMYCNECHDYELPEGWTDALNRYRSVQSIS